MSTIALDAKDMFSFTGRMRRKHYAIVYLTAAAAMLLIAFFQHVTDTALPLLTLLVVAALIPASVRRLHDMGYSGWFVIGIFIVPFASMILLFIPGEPGPNPYGPNPRDLQQSTSVQSASR